MKQRFKIFGKNGKIKNKNFQEQKTFSTNKKESV